MARPGDPSRGLFQLHASTLASAMAAGVEAALASTAEMAWLASAVMDEHGVRAERGDPTGDPPLGGEHGH
jgi:hypothetical protein